MLIVQYIEIPDHGFTCEIEQITSLAGARLVLPVVEYEFHPYIYIYMYIYWWLAVNISWYRSSQGSVLLPMLHYYRQS